MKIKEKIQGLKEGKNEEKVKPMTKEDIPLILRIELEEEFYKNFQVDRLWSENEEASPLLTYLPIVLIIINIVISLAK